MTHSKKKNPSRQRLAPENLKQIFENLPEPIFVTDREGNILLSNSTTALTLGMSLDQLLKSNVRDLVQQGYYTKSYGLEAAEKKCVVKGTLTTKMNFVQYSISTPVLDDDGEVLFVLTTGKTTNLAEKEETEETAKNKELINRRKREIEYLRRRVLETDSIVAESREMRTVLLQAHSVAGADSTVIIYGESGTGKEVIAKYLHRHSKRAKEPFIAVNCATLPENLVESELFGYEKGAFTGAKAEGKTGLFEAANGGTIFLDEIAEMPMYLQSKLLRVLETFEVRRVGSNVDRKLDFRLIVATHKDLQKMVEEQTFRNDLYYRLNVIPILIPPLRERPKDIAALARKFLADFNKKYETALDIDEETMNSFLRYNWPGNVRELRNAVERLVIGSRQKSFTGFFNIGHIAGQWRPTLRRLVDSGLERHIKRSDDRSGDALYSPGIGGMRRESQRGG